MAKVKAVDGLAIILDDDTKVPVERDGVTINGKNAFLSEILAGDEVELRHKDSQGVVHSVKVTREEKDGVVIPPKPPTTPHSSPSPTFAPTHAAASTESPAASHPHAKVKK